MTEAAIIALITSYSIMFNVNPKVAISVARVESGLNPKAVSRDGHDYSIFQLRDTSYPGYSKKALMNPRINIFLGVLHLKKAKDTCIHQKDLNWLTCFNLGNAGAKKVKYPHLWKYVKAVNKELNNIYQQNPIAMAGIADFSK